MIGLSSRASGYTETRTLDILPASSADGGQSIPKRKKARRWRAFSMPVPRSYCTAIRMFFGFASSFFGTSISRMPSRYAAEIFSASTVRGRVNERLKFP